MKQFSAGSPLWAKSIGSSEATKKFFGRDLDNKNNYANKGSPHPKNDKLWLLESSDRQENVEDSDHPIAADQPIAHGVGQDFGCGTLPMSRIEYGQESPLGGWPWAASVQIEENEFGKIHEHLEQGTMDIEVMIPSKYVKVTLGGNDWKRTPEHNIKGYTRHNEYKSHTLNNDIAVIELASPVAFNNNVNRICLPLNYVPKTGHMAYVLGYGDTFGARENKGTTLKETAMLREELVQIRVGYPCPVNMICSQHPTRQTESGDSGGPLMREHEGEWHLIAIVKGHRAECQGKSKEGIIFKENEFGKIHEHLEQGTMDIEVMIPSKYVKVTLGGNDWKRTPEHNIKGYTRHNEYRSHSLNNDIAVIELASPVPFNDKATDQNAKEKVVLPRRLHIVIGYRK
uniref:Peptidase S1 domain-containing protein n=1 Tax=Globodera pallida TaxID=36090 RepID=A0A183BIY4_GLOPA